MKVILSINGFIFFEGVLSIDEIKSYQKAGFTCRKKGGGC